MANPCSSGKEIAKKAADALLGRHPGCPRLAALPAERAGGGILTYAGWQPNGFFGVKFNLKNADVQVV
jgi:hypothetical protein